MRWFKHLVASGDDPDIGAIMSKFGFKGYYLFFRTLEIMSDEFSIENPGEKTFNFQWFLGRFSRKIDKKTLINFLDFCQNSLGKSLEKERIIYSLNGKDIHINFPKLKELTDDYTARIVRSKSEVDTDKIHNNSDEKTVPRSKNKDIRSKNKEHKENIKQIISYLNEKTGKDFKTDSLNYISGRLNDGYTVEECKKVIDIKTSQWLHDPENNKWLRPLTLFRPSNFEGYLNEKTSIKTKEQKDIEDWIKEPEKKEED